MNLLRLLPVILSCLLLAAHFSRAGIPLLIFVCIAVALLLGVKKPWAARMAQVTLAVGTIEWLRTLFVVVRTRAMLGEPWGRAAAIIGGVAVFTCCSLLVFRSRAVRYRYRLDQGS